MSPFTHMLYCSQSPTYLKYCSNYKIRYSKIRLSYKIRSSYKICSSNKIRSSYKMRSSQKLRSSLKLPSSYKIRFIQRQCRNYLQPRASQFRGSPTKVYNVFNTVIRLPQLCCHNVLYFLNNPSVIFLTQLHSEYCRILNTPGLSSSLPLLKLIKHTSIFVQL